jgi:hypothetical protein
VYDFLLFAHVLAAFALVTMTVMYSGFVLGGLAPGRAVLTAQVLDGVGVKTGAVRTSAVLCGVLVVAYVIAVWAMTTKPG